jgi:ATP-dependent helicase HrpA
MTTSTNRPRRDDAARAASEAPPGSTTAGPARATIDPSRIEFPEALPVSARRDEIAAAMRDHQVIVVCGETGSGKTTQLPKVALTLGRGLGAGGRGLIGHTQPRRLAATSVAKRIAQELNSPLGEVVGYKVRFQDRLQRGASVKLMTDGILLAETQSDPLLRAYDTIIVDEAHERSLNIDFLLGHLRQILPRRPDLKVIVTSATIDADRFAAHFASARGPAPVIMVSGRLYPVDVRWRPIEDDDRKKKDAATAPSTRPAPTASKSASARRDDALQDAIADAVDELWQGGAGGDILVFLPGEREIREAADHLTKHLAARRKAGQGGAPAEIVPLFARLSQAEQDRVFETGNGRRIVIATNVAETSLTVPGIRYVIDAGTARVKRYSYRNKVEQLQVEPISQAAANQRAGRCGRVASGVCIRLYDEAGFAQRPRFTDPEILRSSLAGVILRMASLGLGSVEDFPFLEAPPRKAIADGYALLQELGAIDEAMQLTPLGRELARLPLDPRIGRMILAARDQQALAEMLVIAAALSVQDVRDRPLEHQQAADEKHKRFDDERSEFQGLLSLWRWIEEGRGVHGHRPDAAQGITAPTADSHKLSNRQQEQRLREHFVSPRRVREWRDIHAQLHTVAAEQGWRLNASPATYEQLHLALLSGLLGNLGCKSDDDEWYLGARGIKFWRHPGVNLSKRPGRWIVAGELTETTRLYGRGLANIDPAWLPRVAAHLLKTLLQEPHWEKKAGRVIALERATLYGLVVYAAKRVDYALVDATAARAIFIREALVAGDWDSNLPFVTHNRRMVQEIEALEHKSRRQDVLVDDALIEAFYDRQVPADVVDVDSLERWYRSARRDQPRVLMLERDELMRHRAAGISSAMYPPTLKLGGVDCAATYLHEPGDPRDGVTVTVPIYVLNQVSDDRVEWLVPGMLEAKIAALAKSLPQKPRARLVPLPAFAAQAAQKLREPEAFGRGALIDALTAVVREQAQLPVQRADFKPEQLSVHLSMNVCVVDEHGRRLGMGRHLPSLKAQLGAQARNAFQGLAGMRLASSAGSDASSATHAPSPPKGHAGVHGAKPAGPSRPPTSTPSRATADAPLPIDGAAPYTAWTFDALPEMLEVRRGSQSMVGFPALVDHGTHVCIEVFDEPDVAAARHRLGLRRLVALAVKEPLKYVEKNIPDLAKMAMAYMPLGSADELRAQIVETALDRAFLAEPLPTDAASFARRLEEGRARLSLIAQEVARLAQQVLTQHAAALRKLKDAKPSREVAEDVQSQLNELMPKRFVALTPYAQLHHLPRYLQAIVARLDKWRVDPARDAQRLGELRPLLQRYQRRAAELKGARDDRLVEYRWLLEELRVGLFAQELRTATPVSAKRLEKVWAQLST